MYTNFIICVFLIVTQQKINQFFVALRHGQNGIKRKLILECGGELSEESDGFF
jgi:hypothetical protein